MKKRGKDLVWVLLVSLCLIVVAQIVISNPGAVLDIVYPVNNTDYNLNVTQLNYTVSGAYGVIMSIDSGVNNLSTTLGDNFTDVTSLEGTNNWTVWANSTDSGLYDVIMYVNFTKDTLSPNITSITVSVTSTTAQVNWTTDENANSSIAYGLVVGLGENSSLADSTTSHSVNITGLGSSLVYYYNITSCDSFHNCGDVT